MTDEMKIQNQQPSALPYLGVGGAAGAAAGYWGLPKIDAVNKFMTTPAKYSSYEELINEADDKFTKAVESAEGEEKTLMEKAKGSTVTSMTETQFAEQATKNIDSKASELLKAEQDAINNARKALGTNPEKSVEELTKEFVEKNGSREKVVKDAQNGFKDDVKKLFEGKRGGKFWGTVAATAAAGALIAMAFRPSAKEA